MRVGRYVSALAATSVAVAAGIWLLVAPWVLSYPQQASGWGPQVLTDFWTGMAVLVLAFLALALYGGTAARALRAPVASAATAAVAEPTGDEDAAPVPEAMPAQNGAAHEPAAPPPVAPAPAPATASGTLDDMLVPIATALLSDLVKRRAAASGGGNTGGEGS